MEPSNEVRTLSEQEVAEGERLFKDHLHALLSPSLDVLNPIAARDAHLAAVSWLAKHGAKLIDAAREVLTLRAEVRTLRNAGVNLQAEVERLTRERKADDQVFRAVLREKEQAEALLEEARRDAEQYREALREICLAGMTLPLACGDDKEAERAFHQRQAWRFIGVAARALDVTAGAKAAIDAARATGEQR